mmetsp:Transcript_97102/g.279472  ORF Transcript_97102/g.279472 Transcript_97102/m.279472 type:complete len:205 (-) Transcript_97102:729-1343(-)
MSGAIPGPRAMMMPFCRRHNMAKTITMVPAIDTSNIANLRSTCETRSAGRRNEPQTVATKRATTSRIAKAMAKTTYMTRAIALLASPSRTHSARPAMQWHTLTSECRSAGKFKSSNMNAMAAIFGLCSYSRSMSMRNVMHGNDRPRPSNAAKPRPRTSAAAIAPSRRRPWRRAGVPEDLERRSSDADACAEGIISRASALSGPT